LNDPTDAEELKACVLAVDAEFISTSTVEVREHGSTCVFSVFYPIHDAKETDEKKRSWKVIVSNVGDSRAMIIRKDGTCINLTKDHKPEDPHEEHRIQLAGGSVSANRVDGQLAMSRAMGDYQYKANPNLPVLEQKVIPLPDITTGIAYQGDRLFICCDGIVEQMQNEDAARCIHEQMAKLDEAKMDPANLIPDVFDLSLERGSKDNMSAALVLFGPPGYHQGYSTNSNFLPGPFRDYAHDETFFNAYHEDAIKHGVSESEWLQIAQSAPASTLNSGGGGGVGVNQLNQPQMQALMMHFFQMQQDQQTRQ
jgi:protein phosphatase